MFHAPFDAQQIARVAEDPSDVIRAVGEGVTRIAVRLFGVMDDVQATAAVRVDQPAEQQVRLSSDDVLLPIRSRDPPLMLAAGGVLWEKAPKLLRGRIHLDCS